MKISHEVPFCLMEQSKQFNDFGYALVHLFENNPEYYRFFKEYRKSGGVVLLDNSVFELEEAFDSDEFAYWIDSLRPTEYIIPDVLDDSVKTYNNIIEWNSKYDVPGKKIGVIQGATFDEAMDCFDKIYPLVDKIAISFNCKFYETNGKSLFDWMNGRIDFVNNLVGKCNKPVHLLGCSLPQEFKSYKSPEFNFIESVDTSNPIVHALNGIRYTDSGLESKVSTKLIEYLNIDLKSIDMDLVNYNVEKFRSFC